MCKISRANNNNGSSAQQVQQDPSHTHTFELLRSRTQPQRELFLEFKFNMELSKNGIV